MITMRINITQVMIMNIKKMNRFIALPVLVLFLFGCNISPGMDNPRTSFFGGNHVYVENYDIFVPIIDIDQSVINKYTTNTKIEYKINTGDILTIIVWGQPEAFPVVQSIQINNPLNARTVDTNGEIFFPYVGHIIVAGKTIKEVRELITRKLTDSFIDPQVDVTVTKYNSNRRAFLLGELSQPKIITLGIEEVSLTSAISEARGLNLVTSNPDAVYIIRNVSEDEPVIYRANLSSPAEFIVANDFNLMPEDVVFIGTSSITRWNRVTGQFFPFTSLINQVDQIGSRD